MSLPSRRRLWRARALIVAAGVAVFVAALPVTAAADPAGRIHVHLLPDRGYGAEALAVNGSGTVVGGVLTANSELPAVWCRARLTLVPVDVVKGVALDVNEHGLVVGQGRRADGTRVGWTWNGRVLRVLADPFGGGNVQVRRVDAQGRVAGTADDLSGNTFAVRWDDPNHPVVLPALPGDDTSEAHGINDRGDVAGASDQHGAPHTPVVWTSRNRIVPLQGLGGQTVAWAINDRDTAVGFSFDKDWSDPNARSHAVLWRHQQLVDLGLLPNTDDASALAVNNRGDVVGVSGADLKPTDSGRQLGWFSHGAGPLVALPSVPGESSETWSSVAHDVSADGHEVVGWLAPGAGDHQYAAEWTLSSR